MEEHSAGVDCMANGAGMMALSGFGTGTAGASMRPKRAARTRDLSWLQTMSSFVIRYPRAVMRSGDECGTLANSTSRLGTLSLSIVLLNFSLTIDLHLHEPSMVRS